MDVGGDAMGCGEAHHRRLGKPDDHGSQAAATLVTPRWNPMALMAVDCTVVCTKPAARLRRERCQILRTGVGRLVGSVRIGCR
jgi:hypothetical protein